MVALIKKDFSKLASEEQIDRTARALEANGFHTLIAEDREQACRLFFQIVPAGAQVHQGHSATLDELGITAELEKSGRFIALRPQLRSLDRETQGEQIRRLGASPDYMTGSVAALTEDGRVLAASASGRQLGAYVAGAGQVIWVVGAQKIVANLDEGFRRIEEYALPLEEERVSRASAKHTSLNKVVVFYKERPSRITIILVKAVLGY
jgi:L-lactate utilization protein LutC